MLLVEIDDRARRLLVEGIGIVSLGLGSQATGARMSGDQHVKRMDRRFV